MVTIAPANVFTKFKRIRSLYSGTIKLMVGTIITPSENELIALLNFVSNLASAKPVIAPIKITIASAPKTIINVFI